LIRYDAKIFNNDTIFSANSAQHFIFLNLKGLANL